MNEADVVYDWNTRGEALSPPMRSVELHDETLRDGIQCPSVKDPPLDAKMEAIRLLARLGVASVNVGLPGAGPRAVADSEALVTMIRDERLPIRAGCAARTHANDIRPIAEISQRTGMPVEAMMFLGSSPIRMFAEGWDTDRLEALTREAVRLAVSTGIGATFVTEDTVRSHPATLRRLFEAAISEGAQRLVLCDTVGHCTPNGVFNLVYWTKGLLRGLGADGVLLDWHGHNDRGHGLVNALYAIEAGVDRVHGTVLGVGERVGNTSLDQVLVNLRLLGVIDRDLSSLGALVDLVSRSCDVPIPVSYPVFGKDAFRTGTGVHAAAVIKAVKRGDAWLADRVYSGVPAAWFGRRQEIEIGHQSGESNVRYWLTQRGLPVTDQVIKAVFEAAKRTSTLLTEGEILAAVASA